MARLGEVVVKCDRCDARIDVAVDVYMNPDEGYFYTHFDEADVWLHRWTHDAQIAAEAEGDDE